jgi:holo-[acyl-carrier protein] synthase
MLETGIDIVEIDRIADLAARYGARFQRRVYTAREWAECADRPHSLAARFAAKEAAIKALGCREIALHEVEVVRQDDGRPRLALHGRAADRARDLAVQEIAVSLSHSRVYAVASVVLRRATRDAVAYYE